MVQRTSLHSRGDANHRIDFDDFNGLHLLLRRFTTVEGRVRHDDAARRLDKHSLYDHKIIPFKPSG
jgi:hypothetical protein